MGDGTDIIVKGGSVQVVFDGDLYQEDLTDHRIHRNNSRQMIRVRVFAGPETEEPLFDSGTKEEGLTHLVRVTTGPA